MIPKKGPTSFDELLKMATQKGASDLHLKAGTIPVIRKHGNLRPLSSRLPPVSGGELEAMAHGLMDQEQQESFRREKDIDLAYGIANLGRFRINIFMQRGTIRMVIRAIADKVATLEELSLPPVIEQVADFERGLVLVTGATGSGKSSTLAAMIDHINRTKSKHILMIEDPTEYLIRDRRSIITQRELGADTLSFAKSLRAALRQDPDVILIGEMRDTETIETALLAAETGHLVLSTLHTLDAQETINRILAIFDQHKIGQVRMQLASVLRGIISQRLARRKNGEGFVPAVEIMLNNARISELIVTPERTQEIHAALEDSQEWGMQSFDQALMALLVGEVIDYEEALSLSSHPENFAVRYHGVSQMDGKNWAENTAFRKRLSEAWSKLTEVELEEQTRLGIKRRKGSDDKKSKKKADEPPKLQKKKEVVLMDTTEKQTQRSALDKLADFLARRDHSELELREKLSRHYTPTEIDEAIAYAHEVKWLLPPEELAAKVQREWQRKGKGVLFINRYLRGKGLPSVSADSDEEKQRALELLTSKFGEQQKLSFEQKKKAYNYLVNRGFENAVIREAIFYEK